GDRTRRAPGRAIRTPGQRADQAPVGLVSGARWRYVNGQHCGRTVTAGAATIISHSIEGGFKEGLGRLTICRAGRKLTRLRRNASQYPEPFNKLSSPNSSVATT